LVRHPTCTLPPTNPHTHLEFVRIHICINVNIYICIIYIYIHTPKKKRPIIWSVEAPSHQRERGGEGGRERESVCERAEEREKEEVCVYVSVRE